MTQYKLSAIQDDAQAEKDLELVEQGVSRFKRLFIDFPLAIVNLPGHYRKLKQTCKDLTERCDRLASECEAQSREARRLEDESRQLSAQVDQLQNDIAERDQTIQEKDQEINRKTLKIQELKGASYKTVGGDSKTTYAQWIDKYCALHSAYVRGVLDAVDPERFDDVYEEIATALEKGLKAADDQDKLSEADLATAQKRFASYLKDDAKLSDDARDRLARFVELLFDAANSAEASYKESFTLCKLTGTRFDFNYARTPTNRTVEKQGDKGKKIIRCYLPAVFFYFKREQASVCAPALAQLEEENNGDAPASK